MAICCRLDNGGCNQRPADVLCVGSPPPWHDHFSLAAYVHLSGRPSPSAPLPPPLHIAVAWSQLVSSGHRSVMLASRLPGTLLKARRRHSGQALVGSLCIRVVLFLPFHLTSNRARCPVHHFHASPFGIWPTATCFCLYMRNPVCFRIVDFCPIDPKRKPAPLVQPWPCQVDR